MSYSPLTLPSASAAVALEGLDDLTLGATAGLAVAADVDAGVVLKFADGLVTDVFADLRTARGWARDRAVKIVADWDEMVTVADRRIRSRRRRGFE